MPPAAPKAARAIVWTIGCGLVYAALVLFPIFWMAS